MLSRTSLFFFFRFTLSASLLACLQCALDRHSQVRLNCGVDSNEWIAIYCQHSTYTHRQTLHHIQYVYESCYLHCVYLRLCFSHWIVLFARNHSSLLCICCTGSWVCVCVGAVYLPRFPYSSVEVCIYTGETKIKKYSMRWYSADSRTNVKDTVITMNFKENKTNTKQKFHVHWIELTINVFYAFFFSLFCVCLQMKHCLYM